MLRPQHQVHLKAKALVGRVTKEWLSFSSIILNSLSWAFCSCSHGIDSNLEEICLLVHMNSSTCCLIILCTSVQWLSYVKLFCVYAYMRIVRMNVPVVPKQFSCPCRILIDFLSNDICERFLIFSIVKMSVYKELIYT